MVRVQGFGRSRRSTALGLDVPSPARPCSSHVLSMKSADGDKPRPFPGVHGLVALLHPQASTAVQQQLAACSTAPAGFRLRVPAS